MITACDAHTVTANDSQVAGARGIHKHPAVRSRAREKINCRTRCCGELVHQKEPCSSYRAILRPRMTRLGGLMKPYACGETFTLDV